MTLHPSPGGPHIDKCISPNTIRMTLCLGEMFSLFVTHIWTKFFSQMLNRDICLNVQLLHSSLLQRTREHPFEILLFWSFISSCMYVLIGVN